MSTHRENDEVGGREVAGEAEMRAMMNSIAESVLEAPDSQILREAEELGERSWEAADRVRGLLRGCVKAFRQRELHEAWAEYHRQVAAFRERKFALPASMEGKRELLASMFQRYPQMENTFLTVQHRDFKELSDADIESFLKQLRLLGVFGDGQK